MKKYIKDYVLEKPIIIWTLRRTGGTSLADFLFASSQFKTIQHEPFNRERVWGDVTDEWMQSFGKSEDEILKYDLDHLRERLRIYCNLKRNIKHCIDTTPFLITKYLLEVSQDFGYKHVVLLRKNHFKRIISLIIAQRTSWKLGYSADEVLTKIVNGEIELSEISFHDVSGIFQSSIAMIGRLYEELHHHKIDYHRVYFEDLYSTQESNDARIQNMQRLLNFLNIDKYDSSLLEQRMFKSSANTKSVYNYIPNFDHLEALAKFHGII